MKASECGYIDIVQMLLFASADITLVDTLDQTAVEIATMFRHAEVLNLLLKGQKEQAKLNPINNKGKAFHKRGLLTDACFIPWWTCF